MRQRWQAQGNGCSVSRESMEQVWRGRELQLALGQRKQAENLSLEPGLNTKQGP